MTWPMLLALATLLLSAAQTAPVAPAVEPLEPPACFGFFGMVLFESGSTELSANARAMLDNFLAGQRSRPLRSGANLTGYADRVGSRRANLTLARRRAQTVAAYLIAGGVPAHLIEVVARPEEEGLVDTADGVPERQNRNVQILERVPPEVSARWDAWVRLHGYSGPIC